MPDKVFQRDVRDTAIASIALQHEHLVARPSIDVPVSDIRDSSAGAKRSHAAASTPIAVNIFHQNVLGRRFYGDALVLVGYHYIVDPDVVAPDVDAVQTALVAAADGHVVDLAVRARVDGEVEGGRVDQGDVVDGPVGHVPDAQKPGTRNAALLVEFVAQALDGAFAG